MHLANSAKYENNAIKNKMDLLKRVKLYFLVTLCYFIMPITNLYSQLLVDTTRNVNVYKNLFFAPDCGVKVENFKVSCPEIGLQ